MRIELPTEIFTYPDVPLPDVWTVEQRYETPSLSPSQIESQVRDAIDTLLQARTLKPGASVAVGVGSRGLDNLVLVVRTTVNALRAHHLEPFLIPAMGSHGGATAEGQRDVLIGYGVTPQSVGAEIRATMEVDEVGRLSGADAGPYAGHPVYCDRNARTADAILLINRIKAHTDFTGDIESGIGKMSAIGLGKRFGAESIHRYGAQGLQDLMPRVARFQATHLPLLGGVALIENELGHTCNIVSLPACDVGQKAETALLLQARELAPRLPFKQLDVLIIDEMGKNISGAGMDSHVIGRGFMPSIQEASWGGPDIRIVAVLDLTEASHGNATALGLADMTTERLIGKADFCTTFINLRTSGEGGVLRGRLPLILPTGEDCVRTATATCGRGDRSQVRLARIRNTADTQFLEISDSLVEEARQNPTLSLSTESHLLNLQRPIQC